MKLHQSCLSDEKLDALLKGELSSADEDTAQAHLEECDDCCNRMRQNVGDGAWWNEAQGMLADLQPASNSSVRAEVDQAPTAAVIAHLKQWIGPTDDPTKLGRIGAYEVVGIVGVGGAGIVLKAFDGRLNRFVAIKTLLPGLAHSAVARRRFERESQAVAAITHQNVVPIYAVDSYNGLPYLAMHYVAGQSLQRRLDERGPLQPTEIVRIAAQIARALSAAHAQGVIHRDIKPANILLEANIDRVLVTDFGLARVVDEASTHSGAVTGTPQYMSPEQCHGHKADQRTDLFSLGSLIYAMCVGRAPFRSETLMGMLRKICESAPRDVRELNPDIPEWLAAFIQKLHQKHPEDRFESAKLVADLLEAELAHLQSPASIDSPSRSWMPKPAVVRPTVPHTNRYWRFVMPLTALGLCAVTYFAWMPATQSDSSNAPTLTIAQIPLDQSASDDGAKQEGAPVKAGQAEQGLYEIRETRELSARAGGKLSMAVDSGHIEIVTGEQTKLEIIRKIKAESETQAKELLANHVVDAKSEGGNLVIKGEMKKQFQESKDRDRFKQIKFVVTLPREYSLEVHTSGGHVTVPDLKGQVNAGTSGGNVTLANIEGAVKATTSGGQIEIGDTKGDVVAGTSGGNITIGKAQGTVDAKTSGGNVTIKETQGKVVAETSGGNITAAITKQPEGDCTLKTHAGNVRLILAKDLKLSIKAGTSVGSVTSPFSGSEPGKRTSSLEHALNGGGPSLQAQTSAGNVTIEYAGEQSANSVR